MKLSPKQKLIFTSGISLAVMAILAWTFFYLAYGVINARSSAGIIMERIAKVEAEIAQARTFKGILKDRGDDIAYIEKLFVDRERPVELIERLESTASSTRAALLIDLDARSADEEFLALRLTLEGSNQSILKYLSLLELLPYEIKIDEIAFQRSGNEQPKIVGSGPAGARTSRLLLSIGVRTTK